MLARGPITILLYSIILFVYVATLLYGTVLLVNLLKGNIVALSAM